jgi:hypothetical protein
MKGNGTEGKTLQRGKGPNNSKALVSNLKEISSRRGLLLKLFLFTPMIILFETLG